MLIKKYCPILLSMPRNGSTWVQSYIRASYKSRGDGVIPNMGKTLHQKQSSSEFHNEFFGDQEYSQLDTKAKIHLIETLEKLDLVMCHKAFANMFMNKPDLFKWFQSFYKDYNIILLRRRNIWKTYISLLFHNTIDKHVDMKENLHSWHGIGIDEKKEDLLKAAIQTYKVPFKFNKEHFADFTKLVRFYQDEVIPAFPDKWQMWLEDLSDEKLAEMFKVDVQKEVAPLKRLNYLTYFKPKELKLIQDTFEERFDNEFQFYGYEYK
tara:strand:- start:13 stop:807 length:795 start_codon:yes stop_codon:yes gene_type:complete